MASVKTRIQNKHDLEVNWQKATEFLPLPGELIIYDKEVDSDKNVLTKLVDGKLVPLLPEGRTVPYLYERFKIGDGTTYVNDLPFSQEVYNNPDPVLNTIGGINSANRANGFENVPITEIITELLYPYTAPVVGGLSLSPAAEVKEKGIPFNLNSASISVTKKSKPISKVELYRGSALIGTKTPAVSSSAVTVSFDLADPVNSNADSVTYTAKVYEQGTTTAVVEKSAAYTFVNPYYYGVISADDYKSLTNTEKAAKIKGLTKSVATKGTKTWSFTTTTSSYPLIAYPKSYNKLNATNGIKDGNNFTQTWELTELAIDGVDYYVYTGVNSAADGTFTYKFSY